MPLTPSRNSPITSETRLASSWGSLAISVMSMTTSDSLMDLSAIAARWVSIWASTVAAFCGPVSAGMAAHFAS